MQQEQHQVYQGAGGEEGSGTCIRSSTSYIREQEEDEQHQVYQLGGG